MSTVLKFFAGYSILIYLVLAIGLLFGLRAFTRARHELSESVFGLERELANRHIAEAVTAISLVFLLGVAELVLTVFLVPILPAFTVLPTQTINPLVTPTTTISPALLETMGVYTPGPTATAETTGCIPGQIMITSPKPGDIIRSSIELIGTANIPNFGFFKYEYAPLGAETWQTIEAGDTPVIDGNLGSWDPAAGEVTPGYYNLRLVVLDTQGNSLPACVVPVQVAVP